MCNRFHMPTKNTPGRQSTKLPIKGKHKFCKYKNTWKPQNPPNNTHFPHHGLRISITLKPNQCSMNTVCENKLKMFYQFWPFHSVNQHVQPSDFNRKVYRSCKTSTTLEKTLTKINSSLQRSAGCAAVNVPVHHEHWQKRVSQNPWFLSKHLLRVILTAQLQWRPCDQQIKPENLHVPVSLLTTAGYHRSAAQSPPPNWFLFQMPRNRIKFPPEAIIPNPHLPLGTPYPHLYL